MIEFEIDLKPSLYDPPESLQIVFSGCEPVTLIDEPLFTERMVPLKLDLPVFELGGGEVHLPYQVTGKTVLGKEIDQRGTWNLRRAASGRPAMNDSNSDVFPIRRSPTTITLRIRAGDRMKLSIACISRFRP